MKYKTKKNLNELWERLDNMLSEWYNMVELFNEMSFEDDGDVHGLFNLVYMYDPSELTSIKNKLEELIEEKRGVK